jgi:hypothetical protein
MFGLDWPCRGREGGLERKGLMRGWTEHDVRDCIV